MRTMYKCCFCDAIYDWYDGVFENSEYSWTEAERARRNKEVYPVDSGTRIEANCFVLKQFHPVPDREGQEQSMQEANGNLDGLIINLCPDCMRKLLKQTKPDSMDIDCFKVV